MKKFQILDFPRSVQNCPTGMCCAYVLQLEEGHFYVGSSKYVGSRIANHVYPKRVRSYCSSGSDSSIITQKWKPTRVIAIIPTSSRGQAFLLETAITKFLEKTVKPPKRVFGGAWWKGRPNDTWRDYRIRNFDVSVTNELQQ